MTRLADLELEVSYSSDQHNLVRDFYVPCMRCARLYRRAVGYFTSHGLAYTAAGVAYLLDQGGQIQLIASPVLSEEDIEAIERGYKARKDYLVEMTARAFSDIQSQLERDRLNALAWLVESGALEVKLALRVDDSGRLCHGIFHEKMGIFTDTEGASVAFSGSANETEGGLIENFEAIDVFWSWKDPNGRVNAKISRFERLWNDRTRGLEVIEFTDATAEQLRKYRSTTRPVSEMGIATPEESLPSMAGFQVPDDVELRDYQELAIRNWFKNNGRGTFKMATGSGKTITALGLAATLYEKIQLQALVIVCPYRHLVTQWASECRHFGINPILAFESRTKWEPILNGHIYGLSVGTQSFLCVVTTNSTFASSLFQQKIYHLPNKTLLIADEVHNLGATDLRTKLPASIQFRLGLSATPERWFDEKGTQALYNYFGEVLEPQITLADALQQGVLSPYRYYPIPVELTDEERLEYLELSTKIAQVLASGKADEDDQQLTAILIRRSRLIASAQEKLTALRELMRDRTDESHMLFYCGDGTVEDPLSEEESRQIEAVTRVLGYEMGIKVAPYTAETPLAERERLSNDLDSGATQGLVAIRCLDEGVDIPSIKMAVFLASSRNPRQFIQRRGRILRRSPGKESAEIYDMIVVPPKEAAESESERNLLRNELVRFTEFADLAKNGGEARKVLFELQKRFDLMDL